MKNYILIVSIFFTWSCIKTETSDGENPPQDAVFSPIDSIFKEEITTPILSVIGDPFPPKVFEGREKAKRLKALELAKANYESNPDSLEEIVWYGRRLGYMGQYNKAIQVYSEGLEKFSDSYELLRYRGEAFITIRYFDKAMEDLEKAVFFSRKVPNEIEEDGIPNRLRKPIKNVQFNIWYHLGLAYYLKGNFDKAISAYQKCMEVSDNDDLKVATTTWLYRTYIKIGNNEEAMAVLEPIDKNMNLVENRAYHNILMLFKEEVSPEKIYELASQRDNSLDPTVGYGLGNWYVLQGEVAIATETFDQVLAGGSWDSFGYIASEVERANLSSAPL